MLPGILNQLGAESLTHLKRLASNVNTFSGAGWTFYWIFVMAFLVTWFCDNFRLILLRKGLSFVTAILSCNLRYIPCPQKFGLPQLIAPLIQLYACLNKFSFQPVVRIRLMMMTKCRVSFWTFCKFSLSCHVDGFRSIILLILIREVRLDW